MKKIIKIFVFPFVWIYYFILSRLFIKNRVVFISFGGKQYSDNPKAISEYLYKTHPEIKQVWLFRDKNKYEQVVPAYIKIKKFNKFNLFTVLATSTVWVDNDELVYQYYLSKMPKSKKQLFIETWHGDRGIKKSFYCDPSYKRECPFSLEKEGFCDYLVTGCEIVDEAYRNMFNYKGAFLKVGCPRNDILYDDNKVAEITAKAKEKLNISNDTNILLYAPTYKNYEDIQKYEQIDFDKLLTALEKQTKSKWVIVYRTHHINRGQANYDKYYDGRALFDDMADIMPAADMLITDYSSCAGDFMVLGRPIILYIPDYTAFSDNLNGTWWNLIDDTPFNTAVDNAELLNIVKKINFNNQHQNKELLSFFGCYENGQASNSICELINKNKRGKYNE